MINTASRRRLRRAATLLEVMVVLAVVAGAAAVVIPSLGGHQGTANDATAQVSVEGVLTTEEAALVNGALLNPSVPADLTEMRRQNPDMSFVNGTTASADTNTASVHVAGSAGSEVVSIAVFSPGSGSCWLVRRDFANTSGTPTLHLISGSQTGCTGATADAQTPASDGSGQTWSKPQRIS
jgi:type II secretory pathway pseudopilin PulG